VASIVTVGLVLLAVARFETVVALGFMVFGVVLVQPTLSDLVFGIAILVAVLTGRARSAFRRSPPPTLVLYTLGALTVVVLLSAAQVQWVGQAVFFIATTSYLAVFALWLSGYVDSRTRARRLIECLTIGASVIGAVSILALFVSFPGGAQFIWAHRAEGLFDDPNVFGPFMVVPFAFILAEIVEPTLLSWRRRWLLVVLLVCGGDIMFSYSRAAWLNASLVLMTMIAAYAVRRGSLPQAARTLGLGLAAVGILIAALFLTGSTSFFLERAHVHQSYDTARFESQNKAIGLAQTHLLGIGPGQYPHFVGIGAHSTYLRALGEQGVLGLALIVLLMLITLVLACGNVIRGRSTFGISSVPLLGLWVGLIANGFFIDTWHWRHLWLVAGLIWGGTGVRELWSGRSATPPDNGEQRTPTKLAVARAQAEG
ncbi:MAG: O-antigen ligase family protein, partial [Gaiellaceae bacterium]